LDGKVLDKGEVSVKAASFAVTPVCQLDFSKRLDDDLTRQVAFVAEMVKDGQIVARQSAFCVPTKHLELADPSIATQLKVEKGQIHIQLTAKSFARIVECTLEGTDVIFSDNYFDLPTGRTVDILASLPADWTESQVTSAFKVRSIYDSYAHEAAK
jgi:beta-mannosidase